MLRTLSESEQTLCSTLLDDAAVIIDATGTTAETSVKKLVSVRMTVRALGSSEDTTIPIGASQGSMSALGYSQSWTIGSNGAVGEMYLSRLEKKMLGVSNHIGSYSPTEELVPTEDDE